MSAQADTHAAAAAPTAARPVANQRAKPIERFPLKFHFAITLAMGDALKRLTGSNALLSESDNGRLALHSYLLANDPLYVRALNGGGHG